VTETDRFSYTVFEFINSFDSAAQDHTQSLRLTCEVSVCLSGNNPICNAGCASDSSQVLTPTGGRRRREANMVTQEFIRID
jgi:hypothetical protein